MHKNGKIWAESEGEGKGCTFFVHVPLHSHHYVDPSLSTLEGSVEAPSPINQVENVISRIPSAVPSRSVASVANLPVVSSNESPEGKQLELMPLPPLEHPVEEVAADTWKPTILVVDDSPMNRKVEILSNHPLSRTTPPPQLPPPLPPPLTHNSPLPHTLDAGPHVDRERICLS